MTRRQPYELIVFDLGGVLIEYTGLKRMEQWAAGRYTRKELYLFWMSSKAVAQFETGRMSAEQFAAAMVSDLELPFSAEDFLKDARQWFKGQSPGAVELVKEVSSRFATATLANTNALYWPMFEATPLFGLFDHHFPSHLTGFLKPDPRAYDHVVANTGIAPDAMVFLDDTKVNVRQALARGIHAARAIGVDQARQQLIQLGVLGP